MGKYILCCLMISACCKAPIFYTPKETRINHNLERNHEKRVTSYPHISGDTFRLFCDHIFDETGLPLDTDAIKKGDTIFINPPYLSYFFKEVHPHINEPYILVTLNNDLLMPGEFAPYLDDDTLFAWFGTNIVTQHSKMHALPIGLMNSYFQPNNTETLDAQRADMPVKDRLIYANFWEGTHPSRRKVMALFKNKRFMVWGKQKDFKTYVRDVARSQFVLSPRGGGLDCHRTWEAMLLGAIPVILRSAIDELYKGLPVAIVDNWHEVSRAFLIQTWRRMQGKEYDWHKLFVDYWFTKIALCQQRARMS